MNHKTLFQLIIVLSGSFILGAAFNSFNAGGVSFLAAPSAGNVPAERAARSPEEILNKNGRTLTAEEAFVLFDTKSAIFMDARPLSFYKTEHIKGAISVYYKTAGRNPTLDSLEKNGPYVVYCKSPNCNQAQLLAKAMLKAGFTNVFLFPGGMQEWRSSQYPMDRTP